MSGCARTTDRDLESGTCDEGGGLGMVTVILNLVPWPFWLKAGIFSQGLLRPGWRPGVILFEVRCRPRHVGLVECLDVFVLQWLSVRGHYLRR